MAKLIFLNLPVSDVPRATAFYEAIGATRDPRFSTENCSMMAFSETIHFMLLTHRRYADFTSKTIVDARTASEVLIALTEDSRADIDATLAKAVAAGGTADPTPPQEMGDFMYGRSFEDLDGHIIELAWMDVDAAMAASAPGETEPA